MLVECGFWEVDTQIKEKAGHRYFVAKHRFNPTNVELVFIRGGELKGKKELCEFIKNEKIWKV